MNVRPHLYQSKAFYALVILFLSALITFANSESIDDHDAHVHGQASAEVTFSNGILNASLKLPAMDVFGFEHSPKDDAQRNKVSAAKKILIDENNILAITPEGLCALDTVNIENEILESSHEQKHEHEHEHEHHDEQTHSDVTVNYTYHCKEGMLEAVEFKLFKHFTSLKEVDVFFVSDDAQMLLTATPDNSVLSKQ